jgi:Cdc6-like AAA superfamily ATPase
VWLHPGVDDSTRTVQVLLLAGRSGVGKTSVAAEVSELLQAARVAHCLIDGDNLDAAYPKAPEDPHGTALTEANLRALWGNYAAIGHTRAIYVNTVSVLEPAMVLRAVGGGEVCGVLLTASDATAAARLEGREIGSALERHLQRSAAMAAHLEAQAGAEVVRVPTDGRSVADLAGQVVRTCGWLTAP